jgi:hypothetical protein
VRKSACRFALAIALAAAAACPTQEACLAASPLFAGLRPGLIHNCCECLATSGTPFPGAACAEAVLVDGVVKPGDAGPLSLRGGVASIPVPPDDAGSRHDDQDNPNNSNSIKADEVPCLCEDDVDQCEQKLSDPHPTDAGLVLLVTAACVNNGTSLFEFDPPVCQSACQGVINFIPVAPAP